MVQTTGDEPKKRGDDDEGNGRRRNGKTFNIRLDGSMITALAALFGLAGYGVYNDATEVGLEEVSTGVEMHVNATYAQTAKNVKILAAVAKRQEIEIDELYEANDWLIVSLFKMASKNPALWRQLRKDAPQTVLDILEKKAQDKGERVAEKDKALVDEVIKSIDEPPEPIKFPNLDRIREVVEHKKDKEASP